MVVGFGFVFWIRDILLPFFFAFVVAYMLDPLVDEIEVRLHLGRLPAVLLLLLLITIGILGFSYYLADQTVKFAGKLAEIAENPPDIVNFVESSLPPTIRKYFEQTFTELEPQKIIETTALYLRDHITEIVETLSSGTDYLWLLATRTFGALGIIINITVIFIVSIYLLRDFDDIVAHIRTLIPYSRRDKIDSMAREIDRLMRAYFRGYLIICLIIGLFLGFGYELIGLEGGFLVGFISGLFTIIPYVGPALGFLIAFSMALYQFGLELGTLGVVLIYAATQALEGNFLTPKIIGDAVGLNPVIVLFALMVFGKIFGFLGLLLAIPLAAIVKVLMGRLISKYRHSEYFGTPESLEST